MNNSVVLVKFIFKKTFLPPSIDQIFKFNNFSVRLSTSRTLGKINFLKLKRVTIVTQAQYL